MINKKDTHAEIITVAKKLFGTGNFSSVSMSQIAQEVGINKASLYYFFKDKMEIYFDVIEDLMIKVSNEFNIEEKRQATSSFADTIERVINLSISEGSMFVRFDVGQKQINKEQKHKIMTIFKTFSQKVEDFLTFYKVDSPKLASSILISSIHSYVKDVCLLNPKISSKIYSQYLENLFLKK
ncbi:MAG: TetR/AcrR family transcriptional regulator [Patescibacteria group bacterium]|nr:TetR/AcrR family transcriptional regulator [Patescibacteria group bacterium]